MANYCLKNIVYFSTSTDKNLKNNYKILKENLSFDDKFDIKNYKNHNTCPFLPSLIKILFEKKRYIFLDFGCNNLDLYAELANKTNGYILVHDQPKLRSIIDQVIKKKKLKNVSLFDENKSRKIDFLYFGASYQYIENIEKILNKNKLFLSKYIFIAGLITYEGLQKNKFVTLQHNVIGEKKCYFYKKKYIINLFSQNKYRLIFNDKNNSDKYLNFKNFKNIKIGYEDFLFKLND